jgi:CTP synthase (UTP-ammonia lyase)
MVRIDVVFDVAEDGRYFRPTVEAVEHAATRRGVELDLRVTRTDTIDANYIENLPSAVVLGPGTPYLRPEQAEAVVASARERGVPLVGT